MGAVDTDTYRCWVAGQGFIVDMGLLPAIAVDQIKDLSLEQRNEYMTKMMASHPDAFKVTAGYCKQNNTHVHERECIRCARTVNKMTSFTQWDNCRQTNLSR
jgi:hypothetical protein